MNDQHVPLIYKIARMAQSLPTTSATIEQAFSILKLLKTAKRNLLSNESFEALVLLSQEFRINGGIKIDEEMERIFIDKKKS